MHHHHQHLDDRPQRSSIFQRLFKTRERQYPYLMEPDGTFKPDARPYGSRSMCVGILVLVQTVAALLLVSEAYLEQNS